MFILKGTNSILSLNNCKFEDFSSLHLFDDGAYYSLI